MRLTGALAGGLLVLVTACGDGGGDRPADGFRPGTGGDGEGGGESGEIDPCILLEASDVEAAFGDVGPIGDGFHDLISSNCAWNVGETITDPAGDGGTVYLTHYPYLFAPVEEEFASRREWAGDPVDIAGVGDDAFYEDVGDEAGALPLSHGVLTFRSNGMIFDMSAVFSPPLDGSEDRLVSLAQVVVSRL